ncbi:hypothetical protein GXP67_18450 [Rhodocytophaga rosea]|uniref:Lipoprotein n=1 Tax=Rhodocytophaga rosea TaxID=2704465 RepID=A0A6C0GLH9_9BACT|nr:hypothetical protein [Rhodocytophaga rosea]QHT68482.1 hypothetical protein GXP67_18450 [Rhodocytophaga rosea]
MKTQSKTIAFKITQLCIYLGLVLFFACKDDKEDNVTPTPAQVIHVKTSSNAALGNFLTDKDGKTLYFFAKDITGNSACEGGCADAWPIFYEKDLKVADNLNAADFGVITRTDGKKQTTYKGWPLYHFAQDAAAGDTKGEGLGKTWVVASPDYTLMIGNKDGKNFLINMGGRTVYFFGKDTENVSNCINGCVDTWPLISQSAVKVPSLVNKANFGSITRADGKTQTTFLSKPIYYFANDTQRGETKGSAIANWFLSVLE